ncbi:hypothetical protein K502DRAFT_312236 [Neoconidiobolus thromboides FSU 785]|nr:hypothetical protein K502DRAFT_312236 [Neoconidiobolus thromboides FSU 785]
MNLPHYATKEVVYNLTITLGVANPNCFGSPQVLVNGISPGPVIRAKENDLLIINIINNLPKDEFTMHYHGLHQKGTPFYDGVPFMTQLPIPPKQSYQHRINLVGQHGSYLYHSHTKTHALTALGALIIDPKDEEPFKYDEELILVLSDNLSASQGPSPPSEGKAKLNKLKNSTVINSNSNMDRECKPTVFSVDPNKVYRLRLISATTKEYISFAIAGHVLEVVEVEGFYVKPVKLDKIPIHSGQRYSILIKTNHSRKTEFNIHAHSLKSNINDNPLIAFAKLSYLSDNINTSNSNNTTIRLGEIQPYLRDFAASNLFVPLNPVPLKEATKKFYFRVTHEEKEEEEAPRWYVNGTTLKMPNFNLLKEAYKNNTHTYDNTNYQLVHLEKDEVIEVTIQNTVDLAGLCDNHPWHLHGHSFWDLGSGPGTYNPNDDKSLNKIPILRDTFTFSLNLPQGNLTPKEDCGWHTIRFVTDNPGLWIFHCHILKHMDYGMIIYFMEGYKDLPPYPSDITLI